MWGNLLSVNICELSLIFAVCIHAETAGIFTVDCRTGKHTKSYEDILSD